MKQFTSFLLLTGLTGSLLAQPFSSPQNNPVELGKIHWLRSYEEAVKQAQLKSLPIFILFQEVPGCSNCTRYGTEVLSHPQMVEAIETHFIPLAIYNNKGGADQAVLKRFGEPAWNNPVVRLVNASGENLVPRIGDFHSRSLLLSCMQQSMQQNGQAIPIYLQLLSQEFAAEEGQKEEAFLSMYCFWTGEKEIAQLPGVLSTEAGYMHGKEVVRVEFDGEKTSLATLSKQAAKVSCGDAVYSEEQSAGLSIPHKSPGSYRVDREDKYYLSHSDYRFVPMTDLQKSKVNSALGASKDPAVYLSPRQLQEYQSGKNRQSLIRTDFQTAWNQLNR